MTRHLWDYNEIRVGKVSLMNGTCDRCGTLEAERLVLLLAEDAGSCDAYYDGQIHLCHDCRQRCVDLLYQLQDRLQRFLLRA